MSLNKFEQNSSQGSSQNPSTSPKQPLGKSADIVANLELLSEVFQRIDKETSEVAEEIFDYLLDVEDEHIINGTIPPKEGSKKLSDYIKILNGLFAVSRNSENKGGSFRIINRKTVENLDKKTYTISMCLDGGTSLDVLCDIVNVENKERTPTVSPVTVTVKQVFGNLKDSQIER